MGGCGNVNTYDNATLSWKQHPSQIVAPTFEQAALKKVNPSLESMRYS